MKKLLRGHLPNTAVILAAGNGKRLGRLGKKLPKALLELDHKPIILHSIEKLRASGIDKINVVVNRKFQKEFEFLWNHNEDGKPDARLGYKGHLSTFYNLSQQPA